MRVGLIIALSLVVIAALLGIVEFNGISKADEAVSRTWTPLAGALDLRYAAVPRLVSEIDLYTGQVDATAKELGQAVKRYSAATTVLAKAEAADQIEALLDQIIVQAETRYPGIGSHFQFMALKQTLDASQAMMGPALAAYDNAVTLYNDAIRTFPSDIVAALFGFRRGIYIKQGGAKP